jgi:D-alanyl-D-alanine carboxypeptidase
MRGHVLAALAVVLLGVPQPPSPVSAPTPEPPAVTAEAWVVYDATSGVRLAGFEDDVPRPMASVTKVMTALVVRDHTQLADRSRISARAAGVGEAEVGLIPGERWTIEDLLYAMLVRSANDAAMALAEHVGGSVEQFAVMMNEKATELGLQNSSFVNPHGLDDLDHYSSASDLAKLGQELLADPVLAEIVRTRFVVFRPAPDGSLRAVRNTNRLLGEYPDIAGVKTGFTGRAGRVLISALETPDRLLVAVVMASEDHFADSRELLDYGRHLVTFQDRWRTPLLGEEGGAGIASVDAAEQVRLEAVPELWDGSGPTTAITDTQVGQQIEAQLRSLLPVVLGGSG